MSAISVSWLDVSWGAVFFETNYGLMQHSYIEIKDRLLKALDSEYNVVDMATVFDVVAVLEKAPITTEILESTRLGKVINECRRRTNDATLARRAKLLVRKWREMMQVGSAASAPPTSTTAASSNPPTPATLSPVAPPHHQNGTNVRSPNLAVARLGGAHSAISSPSLARGADRLPRAASISPALSASGSGRHHSSNVVVHNNNNNNSSSNNHHHSFSSSGKSHGGAYIGAATLVSPSSSTARSPRGAGGESKVESVPKTHVANMRRRKNAGSAATSPEPPAKVAKVNGALFAGHRHHGGGGAASPPPAAQHYHNIHLLHHHHQDTERLLSPPSTFGSAAYSAVAERLSDEPASPATVTENAASADCADSSFERLDDELAYGHGAPAATTVPEPEPDPPPGTSGTSSSSSSRKRRKKSSKKNRADGDVVREKLQALSKTGRVKTTEELVAELKSLNEDRLAGGAAEAAADRVDSCAAGPSTAQPPSLSNSSYVVSECDRVPDGSRSRVPIERLDAEARVEREIADILARLPPLDVAQIRWDETPPSSPPPPASPRPPTEEELQRYLHGRWDGVNGCVTHGSALPEPSTAHAQDPAQNVAHVADDVAPSVAHAQEGAQKVAHDDGAQSYRHDDEFREWHEMVARRTTNDDLIHILPYSIAD